MDFKRKCSNSRMFFLGYFPQLILALRNSHFHQKCWKNSCIFHSDFSTALPPLKWWIISLCLSVVLYSPWMMKWLQWHRKREKQGKSELDPFTNSLRMCIFPPAHILYAFISYPEKRWVVRWQSFLAVLNSSG